MSRVIMVFLISFAILRVLGPLCIPILHKLKFGQPIRDDGPKSHTVKQGTPTMGGIMMLIAIALSTSLVFYPQSWMEIMIPGLLFSLGCALIGFADDYLKVIRKNPHGLRGWYKVFGQMFISTALALYCYFHPQIGSIVYVPFADIMFDMGVFYIPFVVFVIIALINSANLTDGVDGLLSGTTLIVSATFTMIAFFAVGIFDTTLAVYAAILAASLAGACLGFLQFNTYRASVIMGDTGSFLLGGVLAFTALILRLPLLIPIACVMLVVSSASDILQIAYFQLTHGKRIFRMAPLHHHLELGGMSEAQIVSIYMTITFLACLLILWKMIG